ncbi:MAG: hypothetical protein KAR44_06195 [Candidatus Aegiribacteria sp.]|nr:hypothetical protein [Candidatus Aegiribacteria sp.]
MKLMLLLLLSMAAVLSAQQIVRSFDAPDSGISGLAYHDNTLYAVGSISSTVYELDEMSGSVNNSWTVSTLGTEIPTGIGYAGNLLYIGADDGTGGGGHVYKYTTSGTYQGSADILC